MHSVVVRLCGLPTDLRSLAGTPIILARLTLWQFLVDMQNKSKIRIRLRAHCAFSVPSSSVRWVPLSFVSLSFITQRRNSTSQRAVIVYTASFALWEMLVCWQILTMHSNYSSSFVRSLRSIVGYREDHKWSQADYKCDQWSISSPVVHTRLLYVFFSCFLALYGSQDMLCKFTPRYFTKYLSAP